MISHYESYKTREPAEISELLDMATEITFESKMALQKVVEEKYQNKFTDKLPYKTLINSIEKDLTEIEELVPLKSLSLTLVEDRNALVFKSSNASIWRDIITLLVGILLMLCVIPLVNSIIALETSGLSFLSVVTIIVQGMIILSGLGLAVKAIDRIYFFKSFYIQKQGDTISSQKKESFYIDKKEFPIHSKLQLFFSGDTCALEAVDPNGEKYNFITVESPNYKLVKTLEKVCDRMNNFN